MITMVASNEVVLNTVDLIQHIEEDVSAIAPHPPLPPRFENIRAGLRNVVLDAAYNFKQASIAALKEIMAMGQTLLKMKLDLKRLEYQILLKELGYTPPRANKLIALAKTFDGFNLWQLAAVSVNTLFSLCSKTYSDLVEQMRSATALTTETVEAMMKAARPPRTAPKQQQESSVEWRRDLSGGARHLNVNLYNDELAVEINSIAEEKQITRQEAIADVFRKSKLVEEARRERDEAISEVREMHIELQRENIRLNEIVKQQSKQIEELSAQLISPRLESANFQKRGSVIYIENFDAWEELAEAVNCESDRFVAVMKLASTQEREHFTQLLSNFCDRTPGALDQLDWVPPRLLDSALRCLSFSVQRFADTSLAEDPVFETIQGCKFVGVKEFGTSNERWRFQLPDGKNIAVFERSRFAIERF